MAIPPVSNSENYKSTLDSINRASEQLRAIAEVRGSGYHIKIIKTGKLEDGKIEDWKLEVDKGTFSTSQARQPTLSSQEEVQLSPEDKIKIAKVQGVANSILTELDSVIWWLTIFSTQTQGKIEQFRALLTNEPNLETKREGLVALSRLNQNFLAAAQGLDELRKDVARQENPASKDLESRLRDLASVFQNNMATRIEEIRGDVGQQLQVRQYVNTNPSVFTKFTSEFTKAKGSMLNALSLNTEKNKNIVHEPTSQRPYFVYKQNTTVETLKMANESVKGIQNNISPVLIGHFKAPEQFQKDIARTEEIKLNGVTIIGVDRSEEKAVDAYSKLAMSMESGDATFNLATLLNQRAFIDILQTVIPSFAEKGLIAGAVESRTFLAIDISMDNQEVTITYKMAITGQNPDHIGEDTGAILFKRVLTLPLKPFNTPYLSRQDIPFPNGNASDYISSHIETTALAKRLLENF